MGHCISKCLLEFWLGMHSQSFSGLVFLLASPLCEYSWKELAPINQILWKELIFHSWSCCCENCLCTLHCPLKAFFVKAISGNILTLWSCLVFSEVASFNHHTKTLPTRLFFVEVISQVMLCEVMTMWPKLTTDSLVSLFAATGLLVSVYCKASQPEDNGRRNGHHWA